MNMIIREIIIIVNHKVLVKLEDYTYTFYASLWIENAYFLKQSIEQLLFYYFNSLI